MRIAFLCLLFLVSLAGCHEEPKVKIKAPGVDIEVQQNDKVKVDVKK